MKKVKGFGVFTPQKFELENGKKIESKFPVKTYAIIFILFFSAISFNLTDFSVKVLLERGLQFWDIPRKMFPPDIAYLPKIVDPLLDTIKMSIVGSFVGTVLALPVSFLASNNINKNKTIVTITKTILTLFRTLPVLVYASILSLLFGFGTFAGTVAICIFTFSIVTKMLYDYIETIDLGGYEAILSTGSTKPKAIASAIMPQLNSYFVSTGLYSLEINVRNAAILGYVGAGGIGQLINENIGWRYYDRFGAIFICLFILVLSIESLSRYFRGRLA